MNMDDNQIYDEEKQLDTAEAKQLNSDEIFKLDIKVPEECYIKKTFGRVTSMYLKFYNLMFTVLIIETIALIVISVPALKVWWSLLLAAIVFYAVVTYVLGPIGRKKQYAEIANAGEDEFTYIFYGDYVHIKNASIEANLQYDTAQYYAENDANFILVFPMNRNIVIRKDMCTEEQLEFLRNVVPEKNQTEAQNKSHKSYLIRIIVGTVYGLMLAVCISYNLRIRESMSGYEYTTKYENTSYISFMDCVGNGTVKDIVIYEGRYVEYTFTGYSEDVRYYTTYDGDMSVLKTIFEAYGVNWQIK